MKVKDLIKQLEKFPENMEVVFYNGFVDDVQPISKELVVEELKKHSLKYHENGFLSDWYNKHSKDYSKTPSENEMNSIKQKALERYESTKEYVEFHDNFKDLDTRGWFDKKIKKRLLLQAGRANKTYFDRSGTISY